MWFCSDQTDALLYKCSKCQILTFMIVSSTAKILLFSFFLLFCFKQAISDGVAVETKYLIYIFCLHSSPSFIETWSFVYPPADDMDAVPVKNFIKHVMELYKNNLQGFSEEFEVLSIPIYLWRLLRKKRRWADALAEWRSCVVLLFLLLS